MSGNLQHLAYVFVNGLLISLEFFGSCLQKQSTRFANMFLAFILPKQLKCEKFPVHSPHHIQCRFTIQQVYIAESMLSMLRSNSVNRHLLYMRTHRSCLLSENNGLRKTFKWKTRRKLTNGKLYAAVTHHREVAIGSTII